MRNCSCGQSYACESAKVTHQVFSFQRRFLFRTEHRPSQRLVKILFDQCIFRADDSWKVGNGSAWFHLQYLHLQAQTGKSNSVLVLWQTEGTAASAPSLEVFYFPPTLYHFKSTVIHWLNIQSRLPAVIRSSTLFVQRQSGGPHMARNYFF